MSFVCRADYFWMASDIWDLCMFCRCHSIILGLSVWYVSEQQNLQQYWHLVFGCHFVQTHLLTYFEYKYSMCANHLKYCLHSTSSQHKTISVHYLKGIKSPSHKIQFNCNHPSIFFFARSSFPGHMVTDAYVQQWLCEARSPVHHRDTGREQTIWFTLWNWVRLS